MRKRSTVLRQVQSSQRLSLLTEHVTDNGLLDIFVYRGEVRFNEHPLAGLGRRDIDTLIVLAAAAIHWRGASFRAKDIVAIIEKGTLPLPGVGWLVPTESAVHTAAHNLRTALAREHMNPQAIERMPDRKVRLNIPSVNITFRADNGVPIITGEP